MKTDLDNFPVSLTARRMMSRITGIYDRSYVGKWIFEIMGAEFDFAHGKFGELRIQTSPDTATWGLKYWEQRYGIYPEESDPIEERRRRVISRRIARLPMNPVKMEQILSAAYGCRAKVEENVAPYTFSVEMDRDSGVQVDIAEVLALIQKIKPAHQSCQVCFVKTTSIYAGAGQSQIYKPAAIMDGYSAERKTGQAICTGAVVYQTIRQTVKM